MKYLRLLFLQSTLVLVQILILLPSCNNSWAPCGQQHFLDEKYKIDFSLGDTLTYTSNLKSSMKFYISLLDSGVISYPQTGKSSSGCNAYYEFEIIGICPLNDSSCIDAVDYEAYWSNKDCQECENCMTICKKMSTKPIHSNYKQLEDPELSYFDLLKTQLSNYDEFRDLLIINDYEYKDCYVFHISSDTISEIYYNYKYGFVGFKMNNEILYNLVL